MAAVSGAKSAKFGASKILLDCQVGEPVIHSLARALKKAAAVCFSGRSFFQGALRKITYRVRRA